MVSVLDNVQQLIEQGEKLTWDNFSTKNERGYPNGLSADWLVWTHHVSEAVNEIKGAKIAEAINSGLVTRLIGNGQDKFDFASNSIVNGLKAAQRVYSNQIPASDRVVSLGHNSPEQSRALEKIDEIVAAVQESNDFPGDEEAKQQIIAELSAGRRLLEASRVRVAALASTLAPPLKWLIEKAASSVVGRIATAAFEYFSGMHFF